MKRLRWFLVGVACAAAIAVGTWVGSRDTAASRRDDASTNRDADLLAERSAIPASIDTREPLSRITMQYPLFKQPDTDGLNVRAFVDKLAQGARQGDADAAMRIYRAEAICARNEENARSGLWSEREGSWASVDDLCAGVTPAQLRERLVFLDQALRSGSHEAMLAYRYEGPDGFEVTSLDPTDPRLIAWKLSANAYLRELAASGDYEAWVTLSTDYELGIVTAKDYRSAILYFAAWTAARHPGTDPLAPGFVADMAKQLSADDVQQAVLEGTELGRRFPFSRKRS